ncbi:PLP-dependent transferase [Xylariaceae sp. FL0255]|nr:PLP-dependent transferase [Xylariaceae sp. FL0255]
MDSEFGGGMLQHFDFEPGYRNLNHGSFGTVPREITKHMHQYQRLSEANPDRYIRFDYPIILDDCRAATAEFLKAPTDTVVFVPNATTGINTILRNLTWDEDCRDVILYFSTIYGSCGKTIDYIVDSSRGLVSSQEIAISYPCEDHDIIEAFQATVHSCAAAGNRARVCLYDTVSSLPGVRLPFEELTKACRNASVLSLVDGAQGVGMIDFDLWSLDPDFFVSNLHKWLFTPRGSAVLYVPLRNQHMIASTLPTSHGYVPKTNVRPNPLPQSNKSPFVTNFEFTGSIDTSPFVCVKHAMEWRQRVLGGETRIMEYVQTLAQEGGKIVARILGTEVLDNSSKTLSRCGMTNIALPVDAKAMTVKGRDLMLRYMLEDYHTFIPIFVLHGRVWARISAQVYLDKKDFEWAGHMLLELCERFKHSSASNLEQTYWTHL